MSSAPPDGALEEALFATGHVGVAGVDEVGRGAWAGPLSVGVALVTPETLRALPAGIRDSKQLSPRAREALFCPLSRALAGFAVAHASARECDALGMTAAQALAASRALELLGVEPDVVVVDGPRDFTQAREVRCLVGADRLAVSVAAASVLAKVTRDRHMVALAARLPGYGLERHKGYASREHREAVAALGLSDEHRQSWSVAPAPATRAGSLNLAAMPAT